MKQVLVIVPFPMTQENRDQRREQLDAVTLGPDIEFTFESVRVAPRNYVSASDMVIADIGVLEAGLEAESRGFDAVCIDTMSDSGVAALRSELSIPVIGPGRAVHVDGSDAREAFFHRSALAALEAHLRENFERTASGTGLRLHPRVGHDTG